MAILLTVLGIILILVLASTFRGPGHKSDNPFGDGNMQRALMIGLALLLGIVGLLMSLCGGGVSLMSLGDSGAASILVMSVPSLLLGIGLIWLCVRILRRIPTDPEK